VRPPGRPAQAAAFVRLAAERVSAGTGENAAFARDAQWGMFLLPVTTFLASDTRLDAVWSPRWR
jgi:hypothetical protein